MTRRGFVLVAVLWLIASASGVALLALGAVRTEEMVTRNRWLLARSRWAAEACLAIALGSFEAERGFASGREPLGRGTVCEWRYENPAAALNVAVAERATLERFLTRSGVAADVASRAVDSLVGLRAAGPLGDVQQLDDVPGFPERLRPFVTVLGSGLVDPRAAPREVLAALPGITEEAIALVMRRRDMSSPFRSLVELAAALSPPARAELLASYADLARQTSFETRETVLVSTGWVATYGERPRVVLEAGVQMARAGLAVQWRRLR
jgi:type II secretory pathway component PulK